MENKPAIGEGALNKVKSKSKARWEILRNAIVDKRLVGSGDITFIQSVRRFDTFELFTRKQCTCVLKPDKRSANKKKPQCSWFSYICEDIPFSKEVWIQHLFSDVNLKVSSKNLQLYTSAAVYQKNFLSFLLLFL